MSLEKYCTIDIDPHNKPLSTDNDVLAERTVQPAVEQRADGAQNSLNAIGAALKLRKR
jgi:hypothetical protein